MLPKLLHIITNEFWHFWPRTSFFRLLHPSNSEAVHPPWNCPSNLLWTGPLSTHRPSQWCAINVLQRRLEPTRPSPAKHLSPGVSWQQKSQLWTQWYDKLIHVKDVKVNTSGLFSDYALPCLWSILLGCDPWPICPIWRPVVQHKSLLFWIALVVTFFEPFNTGCHACKTPCYLVPCKWRVENISKPLCPVQDTVSESAGFSFQSPISFHAQWNCQAHLARAPRPVL